MNEFNSPRADDRSLPETADRPVPPDLKPPAEHVVDQPEQNLGEETRLREELKWYEAAIGQYEDVTTMSPDRLRGKSSLVERFIENYWTPSQEQKQQLGQLYDVRLSVESRTEPTPIESARVAVALEVYSQTYSEKLSLLEQQAQSRPTLFEANETMKHTRRQLADRERLCQGVRELSGRSLAATASLEVAESDFQLAHRRHEINQQVFLEAQDRTNQIDDWAEQVGLTRDEVAGHLDRHEGSQRIDLAHRYAADQVFTLSGLSVRLSSTPGERLIYGLSRDEQIERKVSDRLGSQLGAIDQGDEYAWVSERVGDLYDLVDYDKPLHNAHHETSRLNKMMPGWEGRLSDYRENESRYAIAYRFGTARDAIKSIIDDRATLGVNQVYDEFDQTRLNERTQLIDQIPADLLKLFEA